MVVHKLGLVNVLLAQVTLWNLVVV
jgi:hypothetical protein